jgi:hypothetical protein
MYWTIQAQINSTTNGWMSSRQLPAFEVQASTKEEVFEKVKLIIDPLDKLDQVFVKAVSDLGEEAETAVIRKKSFFAEFEEKERLLQKGLDTKA